MRLLLVSIGLAVSLAGSAYAQAQTGPNQPAQPQSGVGNPAATPAGTPQGAPGMPAANQPNDADRAFVHAATIGGRAEVELGRLAEQKGASDPVKAFGRRMVEDHGKANQQLAAAAAAAHLPAPQGLDAEDRTMQEELRKLSGAAFDRAYLQGALISHQTTAQLFAFVIGSGQDPQLKSFAVETLPIIMSHLQMVQDIQARLFGHAPPHQAPLPPQLSSAPAQSPNAPPPEQRMPEQH